MDRIAWGCWGFFSFPFTVTKPTTPATMLQTCPTETIGESHHHQNASESVLTSALDSDSDSVLDSTMHFCCGGGRERNGAQSRSYRSFGLKLKFQYKLQILCFSKAFPSKASLSFQISHICGVASVVQVRHKGKIEVPLPPPPPPKKKPNRNLSWHLLGTVIPGLYITLQNGEGGLFALRFCLFLCFWWAYIPEI